MVMSKAIVSLETQLESEIKEISKNIHFGKVDDFVGPYW